MNLSRPGTIIGVDFSGAALAGDNIWLAHVHHSRLLSLDRLADLAGTPHRAPALAFLADAILHAHNTTFAIDFPFALPVELFPTHGLAGQAQHLRDFPGSAADFGRQCVANALAAAGTMHIRRLTDRQTKTPFDCYHYRIIHQTFHGIRDIIAAVMNDPQTAILPFQYNKLPNARRIVIEACPSSTLKRLALPHQRYKQPAGGPLTPTAKKVRHQILDRLQQSIQIPAPLARKAMRNPGGDALDAIIAAAGAQHALQSTDHPNIATHVRYPLEGFVYA